MKYLLYVSSAVGGIVAWGIFHTAHGAIHEIAALICLLIAAVCLVGGAVIGSIERIHQPSEKGNG